MSNLKIFFIVILALNLVVGLAICICNFIAYNTFEKEIVTYIRRNCSQPIIDCRVRVKDITNFEWDQLVVFDNGFEVEEVTSVLGVKAEESDFSRRKIVFLNDGKIVLYDELPTHIEHNVKNQVGFDIPSGEQYERYTPETADFRVKERAGVVGLVYILTRENI